MNLATTIKKGAGQGVEPLSILLAEDNEVTHELMTLLLTRRGYKVDTVVDGKDALEALGNGTYDVAMIDFHLPSMNGLDVVINYRNASNSTLNLPRFIGMTADIEGLLAHPANCENFDYVFAKPFEVSDVCDAIENAEYHGRKSSTADLKAISTESPDAGFGRRKNLSNVVDTDAAHTSVGSERRLKRRSLTSLDGTVMLMADGQTQKCEIRNISSGGAAVDVETKPAIGDLVFIGRNQAQVIRHMDSGVAVTFTGI